MEVLGFDALCRRDFTVRGINAMPQNHGNGEVYSFLSSPRPEHGVIYFQRCGGLYQLADGRTLEVGAGSLVYLPKGARYLTRFKDCAPERPSCLLVNFQLEDGQGRPCRIEEDVHPLRFLPPHAYEKTMRQLIATFYAGSYHPGEMKSLLYHLLVSISDEERRQALMTRRYRAIAQGILLLERPDAPDLTVSELSALCSVSESCFRKLFKDYAGVSPAQYRLQRKIRQACALLRAGTHTVGEVAEAVGISDLSYFCRLFRQKTGVSPSAYAGQDRPEED